MKRMQVRSKEINRELVRYGVEFSKKDSIEIREDSLTLLIVNGKPCFFFHDQQWVPTLHFVQHQLSEQRKILKTVVVDMGAIKFLVGGADVMRPGVVKIDPEIVKDEPVVIVDQNNHKPIIVGIALFSGAEMEEAQSGKIIKNIHYVGDAIWKAGPV
ncbi:DUF1947 domain-containing protein [Candidatus Woesearchaeota archaeon]|nr:DUF1947 domain-containing protein [Candidatus Woesearchaeota archaeon]